MNNFPYFFAIAKKYGNTSKGKKDKKTIFKINYIPARDIPKI